MKSCFILMTFFPLTLLCTSPYQQLKNMYDFYCKESTDIRDHIPVLKNLTQQCASAVEIGIRSMVSTWAILQGLVENNQTNKSYIGIDLAAPPAQKLALATHLAEACSIKFQFIQANDMTINIAPVDLLFIDSLHTYCHLTYELEKFAPQVRKYIALHDTSEPWGELDDNTYHGDYSEYPAHFDRSKRGLWAAVKDFLERHPEWSLHQRYFNCHGFTILKRIQE